MKKVFVAIISMCLVFSMAIGFFMTKDNEKKEYLRIHIRANSNNDVDQQVKYLVKDAVVEFLTPYIATIKSKKEAEEFLKDNMEKIEVVADDVLKKNGFNYLSKGEVKNEQFPTRVYDEVTLESGYYDALIIKLGEGCGDNWWCVVYPPLCFVGQGTSYVYKSKIKEIIEKFYDKDN